MTNNDNDIEKAINVTCPTARLSIIAKKNKLKRPELMHRMIDWFNNQDRLVQLAILGLVNNEDEWIDKAAMHVLKEKNNA